MSGYKLTTVKKQQQTLPKVPLQEQVMPGALFSIACIWKRGSNSANNNNDINFPKVVLEEQVMPGAFFSITCTWKGAPTAKTTMTTKTFPKWCLKNRSCQVQSFQSPVPGKGQKLFFISVIFSSWLRFALTLCAMDRSGQCCLSL